MNTNIFVPKRINVGFQNRSDTYTGKLAYVIYYDAKGKLRKETSWQSWRDKSIPNEEFDNEPTEGFVLNRRAGGVEESWGWNPRKTYCRVYDPRGFEFEITIANLLWILENCNSIKGKGLEGEFVYGWDGKDLVLVPVESPDYKEIQEKNKIIRNNEYIKVKDLIVGATYETLKGEQYVYMGKFDKFEKDYNSYHELSYYWNNYKKGWEYPLDETWIKDRLNPDKHTRYRFTNKGKHFFFIKLRNSDYSWERDRIEIFRNVTRKFLRVINKEYHENYIEFVEKLNGNSAYSPIDYDNSKIIKLPFENFVNAINQKRALMLKRGWEYESIFFGINENDELKDIRIYLDMKENKIYYKYEEPYEDEDWYGTYTGYKEVKKCFDSIEELYNNLNPVYGEYYLANGYLYERKYYHE